MCFCGGNVGQQFANEVLFSPRTCEHILEHQLRAEVLQRRGIDVQHAQQVLLAPSFAVLVLGDRRCQLKTPTTGVELAERFSEAAPPALALLLSRLALRQVRDVARQHERMRWNAHAFGNQCKCRGLFLRRGRKHDGCSKGQQCRFLARSKASHRDVLNHVAQRLEIVWRFSADDSEDGCVALGGHLFGGLVEVAIVLGAHDQVALGVF